MQRVKSETLIRKNCKTLKNTNKNGNKVVQDTRFVDRDTKIYSQYMEVVKKSPEVKLD